MVTERERTRRDEGRRRRRRCLRLFLEVIIDGGNVDIMLLIISIMAGLPPFIAGSSPAYRRSVARVLYFQVELDARLGFQTVIQFIDN
jgi:hypothetical protein